MNKGKLIHFLLVVALCYGQLIANIHAIGHLDTPVVNGSDLVAAGHDARTVHHNLSNSASAADGSHWHATTTSEHDAEIECAIYHTYFSQGSALCGPADHSLLVLTYAAEPIAFFVHPLSLAVQNPPIRAPPTLS